MLFSTAPHLRTFRPSPTTVEFTVSTQRLFLSQQRRHLVSLGLVVARLFVLTTCIYLVQQKVEHDRLCFNHGYGFGSSSSGDMTVSSSSSPHSPLFLTSFSAAGTAAAHGNDDSRSTSTIARIVSFIRPAKEATRSLVEELFPMLYSPSTTSSSSLQYCPVSLYTSPLFFPFITLAVLVSLVRPYRTERLLVLRGLGIQISSSSRFVWPLGSEMGGATRFIPTAKVRDVLVNEAFLGYEARFYLVVVVEGEDDIVVVFRHILPPRDIVLEVWNGVRGCLWEDKTRAPTWVLKNTMGGEAKQREGMMRVEILG